MGFFDRFKRKPAAPEPASRAEPPREAEPPRDHGKPRPQHYEFAHRTLPIFAFRNPDTLVERLAGGDQGAQFLEAMWRTVGKTVVGRGLPTFEARFSPAVRRTIRGGTLWLIACPPTATALEAAWVAVLQRSAPSAARPVAYFTLEVGTRVDPLDPPYHVVCEWQHKGFHVSPQHWTHWASGRHSAPEPDAFAAAIAEVHE